MNPAALLFLTALTSSAPAPVAPVTPLVNAAATSMQWHPRVQAAFVTGSEIGFVAGGGLSTMLQQNDKIEIEADANVGRQYGLTLIAISGGVLYHLPSSSNLKLYVGGGIAYARLSNFSVFGAASGAGPQAILGVKLPMTNTKYDVRVEGRLLFLTSTRLAGGVAITF